VPPRDAPGIAVLLRRFQSRPGASDDDDVLGLCERGALATALGLAQPLGAQVTAIALGPARREDRVLAMALRAGCDRALRVVDDGIDDLDYFGMAQVLAAAIRHVSARVVVCGDRSQDERTGAVGPAVAELLDAAHLTQVIKAEAEGGALIVDRAGDGTRQRFKVSLPAVLCTRPPPVNAGPRLSTEDGDDGRVRRAAALVRVPTIEEIDLARLGVEPLMLAHRRRTAGRLRPMRGRRRALVSRTASELVERLRADQLLDGAAPRKRRVSTAPRGTGEPGAGR